MTPSTGSARWTARERTWGSPPCSRSDVPNFGVAVSVVLMLNATHTEPVMSEL